MQRAPTSEPTNGGYGVPSGRLSNRSSLCGGPWKQPFFNKTANDVPGRDMDLLD